MREELEEESIDRDGFEGKLNSFLSTVYKR